jgi:hypothetical protein
MPTSRITSAVQVADGVAFRPYVDGVGKNDYFPDADKKLISPVKLTLTQDELNNLILE